MKSTLLIIFFISTKCFAINKGDIYPIAWNSDSLDQIVLLVYEDIQASSCFYFTDNEYNLGWNFDEGIIKWNSPDSVIKSGYVIYLYDCNTNTPYSNFGTLEIINYGFDLRNSNDAIYFYESDSTPFYGNFNFITAFINRTSFNNPEYGLLDGTDLIEDITAFAIGNFDNWMYNGLIDGYKEDVLLNILDFSSFEHTDGVGNQSMIFDYSVFFKFTIPLYMQMIEIEYIDGNLIIHDLNKINANAFQIFYSLDRTKYEAFTELIDIKKYKNDGLNIGINIEAYYKLKFYDDNILISESNSIFVKRIMDVNNTFISYKNKKIYSSNDNELECNIYNIKGEFIYNVNFRNSVDLNQVLNRSKNEVLIVNVIQENKIIKRFKLFIV